MITWEEPSRASYISGDTTWSKFCKVQLHNVHSGGKHLCGTKSDQWMLRFSFHITCSLISMPKIVLFSTYFLFSFKVSYFIHTYFSLLWKVDVSDYHFSLSVFVNRDHFPYWLWWSICLLSYLQHISCTSFSKRCVSFEKRRVVL